MPILVPRSSSPDEIDRIRSHAKCVNVSHDTLPAEVVEEDDVTSHRFSQDTMSHPCRGRLPDGSIVPDAVGCEPPVKPNGEAAKEAALDGTGIHQRRGSAVKLNQQVCKMNSPVSVLSGPMGTPTNGSTCRQPAVRRIGSSRLHPHLLLHDLYGSDARGDRVL
ncbi:hypothetical protein D1007_41739 [Hordeum vulgare]|nr:hypothetical protein D1007_41739 [Hordeum vulgare]